MKRSLTYKGNWLRNRFCHYIFPQLYESNKIKILALADPENFAEVNERAAVYEEVRDDLLNT
jgi:hypothetical protein